MHFKIHSGFCDTCSALKFTSVLSCSAILVYFMKQQLVFLFRFFVSSPDFCFLAWTSNACFLAAESSRCQRFVWIIPTTVITIIIITSKTRGVPRSSMAFQKCTAAVASSNGSQNLESMRLTVQENQYFTPVLTCSNLFKPFHTCSHLFTLVHTSVTIYALRAMAAPR